MRNYRNAIRCRIMLEDLNTVKECYPQKDKIKLFTEIWDQDCHGHLYPVYLDLDVFTEALKIQKNRDENEK